MTVAPLPKLHRLLQQALEVELFTIPPYLTALYSIVDGSNRPSVTILQSVAMEEMLHAALVSNVMNAVGASPRVWPPDEGAGLTRAYFPAQAPHIARPLRIELLPFSREAIEGFIQIERPEDRKEWATDGGINTIGQLYEHLRNALIAACEELGERQVFCGSPSAQMAAEEYYGGAGGLSPVTNLEEALSAIEEISQQGEGRVRLTNVTGDDVRFHQPKEVAHYYRFEQIKEGRYYDRDDDVDAPNGPRLAVDWTAVRPIAANPPAAGAVPGLDALLADFETTYSELLAALHRAFNGQPAEMGVAVPLMQRLKYQTTELMRIEIGGGKTCPPPFWFMQS